MKTHITAGVVFAFLLAIGLPAYSGQIFQLSDNQPPDYPTTLGDIKFAELVNERSNGRIIIDVYHSAQLFDEKSAIEALQMGGLAFCRVNAQPISDFSPIFGVLSLPYIFRDEDHLWKTLNGPIGNELLDELKVSGIVGLTYYDSGSRSFYNNKRAIRTVADMKGLKIRVQQSKLMMGLVTALGASPTPMAYGEVFAGLQSGVIDGAENNWPSYFSTSHFEVAPFLTLNHHTRTPEVLCMSLDVWNELTPDDQALVKKAAVDSQITQREAWKEYEKKAIEAIRNSGKVTITEAEQPDQWRQTVAVMYDGIDLGPKKAEFVRKIQEVK